MYIFQEENAGGMLQLMVNSEAVNFGYSVFETMCVQDAVIMHLSAHMKRLRDSCEVLDIAVPPVDELECKLTEYVSRKTGNFALKVLAAKMHDMPLIFVSTRDIPYAPHDYDKGFKLCISNVTRDSGDMLLKIKSANCLGNYLAKKEALQRGFNEAVFLNECGNFTEGATTNIFFAIGDEIVTPPVKDGLLPGIMRHHIMSKKARIRERSVHASELESVKAAFVTNSLLGVMNVSRIEDNILKDVIRLP